MSFAWGRFMVEALVVASLIGLIVYAVYSVLRALLRGR
jgi:predicted Co/Zn/Cd cation transporter (cation efflux family)